MAECNSEKRIERIAGHALPFGYYIDRPVNDDVLWSALCGAFSSKASHDTSYKYGFMKAILDNLYNVDDNYRLNFDQLFGKFAEIYWNLILKYEILQKAKNKSGKQSYIESILQWAKENYELEEHIPYESLPDAMKQEIAYKVKMKCKTNVVGALFGDTMQLFYSFSKKEEWLQFNPQMYDFLCKHKLFVEKVNYFEWASFLEKINDEQSTMHLLSKLDESAKRNNLSVYRQLLYNEFESRRCFYCGRPMNIDHAHVDHFVPWSFIKDDKLWNFVLACPDCNIRKKDRLPIMPYLELAEDRNVLLARRGVLLGMENYQPQRLRGVYGWAQKNGYDELWQPKRPWLYRQVGEDFLPDVAE